MKASALVATLLALGGIAVAGPDVKRKATPKQDKFAKAAAEAFAEASAADDRGDLKAALGLYEKAQAIAPHPNTAYNIGDVQRRLGRLDRAIEAFETYLAMLPDAPDRKECEGIIDGLAHTPGKLRIVTIDKSSPEAIAFKDFYVLVDGEVKIKVGTPPVALKELGGREGYEIMVAPGKHAIDVVSAISYGDAECDVGPGGRDTCSVRAKPRIDGRFVFRSGDRDVRAVIETPDDRDKSLSHDRVELPVGKRKVMIRDRSFECPAITIDVPAGTADIGYLFVTSNEFEGFQRCRKVEARALKLHFE